ncbi:hypothetical protein J4221_01780 [Candidatus Pacearchaeota archaeon]|nr:hypothetical protein [Candidatus Pacearchaeota archaeon]
MKKLNNVLSIGQSKLIESIDGYITFNEYYRVWLDKIPLPTHYRLQDILLSPAFDSLFDESKALQRSEELNGNPVYRIRNKRDGKAEVTRVR